jgi:hypothetical protein
MAHIKSLQEKQVLEHLQQFGKPTLNLVFVYDGKKTPL